MKKQIFWSLISVLLIFLGGNGLFGQNDVSWRIAVSDKEDNAQVHTTYYPNFTTDWKAISFSYELDSLPEPLQKGEVYFSVELTGKSFQNSGVDVYFHPTIFGMPLTASSRKLENFHEAFFVQYTWTSELFTLKNERTGLVFLVFLNQPKHQFSTPSSSPSSSPIPTSSPKNPSPGQCSAMTNADVRFRSTSHARAGAAPTATTRVAAARWSRR
ncbi:MAG: hypothetical protein R3B47_08540 [Bacteroidia bacterium]